MPGAQAGELGRDLDVDRLGEIEGAERGDIGDRKTLAGDEIAARELAVQEPQGRKRPIAAVLAPIETRPTVRPVSWTRWRRAPPSCLAKRVLGPGVIIDHLGDEVG